jgi:hypothetical protein
MDFSETVKAQLAGRTVRVAPLLRFDFASGAQRYWPGFGSLVAGGETWIGTQNMAQIGEVVASANGSAPEQTFTLSGVDATFVAEAQAARAEYYGRLAFIYFQFFDEHWQVLDGPVPFWWGRMYGLTVKQASEEDGFTRTITLSAETVFAARRRPRNSYYTDRDQQGRFPGDKGCERVLGMQSKLITFPDY